MDFYLKTSEGRQPGPRGRLEPLEWGLGSASFTAPLIPASLLPPNWLHSQRTLEFPTGLKFRPSLVYSVLSEEREQHPAKANKNAVLLEAQLWLALELLGPPRKRSGWCFKAFPFHSMLFFCLSVWGP